MKRLKRVSISEQVIDEILKLLRSGDYRKGDKLPSEAEISSLLGVGRNSVREATKALELAGIIESTAGKGTFLTVKVAEVIMNKNIMLKAIQSVSIKDLMEVRIILEVEIAGFAAARASDEELTKFREKWIVLEKALKNKQNTVSPGIDFHQEILKLSGNVLLENMMESIIKELKAVRTYLLNNQEYYWQEYWQQELKEHKQIYEAIINHDVELARQSMRNHLEEVQRQLEKQVN